MTPERWQQIERLYHEALARDASERGPFLSSACGGDEMLRREVESLLAQPVSADGPLDGAAAALVSDLAAPLATGTRIGVYAVQGLIDKGGMGEVYRARDTRLGRDVAIKILPPAFTSDPERLARFEREARVLASLNHPNIATIHGLEEAGDTRAIVMELVDGETLAARVARVGALRLDDALAIGRQMADALDAAHQKGIVHRDLKPANVIVSTGGTVKVLDFGLARIGGEAGEASEAATLTATRDGVILGTAAYMSPEQARGHAVDKRADIWAFGCVLYETLCGRRAFEGGTSSDVIAAVLEREPDWRALPSTLPPALVRILRRCLEKDLARRQRDIGDVRVDIDDIAARGATEDPSRATRAPIASRVTPKLLVALAGLVVTAVAATAIWRNSPPPTRQETRLDIVTPPTDNPAGFALSPDGRQLVFVARDGATSKVWLRRLDQASARPLAGTDGADFQPFWSPDNRAVGFIAGGAVKIIELASGAVRTVARGPRQGAWAPDGTLLLGSALGPLVRVPSSGGQTMPATRLQEGQTQHWHPTILPDGRHFLYYAGVGGGVSGSGILMGSLDTPSEQRRLVSNVAGGSAGPYVAPGWLLYVQQNTLLARRFDPRAGEVTGDAIEVAESMGVLTEGTAVSASASGVIAYRANTRATLSRLTWFDRTGRALGTAGPQGVWDEPDVATTGERILAHSAVFSDITIMDGDRMTQVAVDRVGWGRWSPDGQTIVFSRGTGRMNLYWKPSSSTSPDAEQPLVESAQNKVATSWSADGFLLFDSLDSADGMDIWVLPMKEPRVPRVWLKTRFVERGGQFSPDGRFVAYQSNESGRFEIYVRPFDATGPAPTRQWSISSAGGISPRWSPDGKELYYIAPDATLMAVTFTVAGGDVRASSPVALFATRIRGGGTPANTDHSYDVSRDGRFLINTELDEDSPITIIQNWQPQ